METLIHQAAKKLSMAKLRLTSNPEHNIFNQTIVLQLNLSGLTAGFPGILKVLPGLYGMDMLIAVMVTALRSGKQKISVQSLLKEKMVLTLLSLQTGLLSIIFSFGKMLQ